MQVVLLAVLLASAAAEPRWTFQDSGTSERLRGVSVVSSKVAWASGNKGMVLRTVDGGATWSRLVVPEAGDRDFRDIEAFDHATAYVLAIGSGDQSRIYKTADGGETWTLQHINPDPSGFYDAIAFWDVRTGLVMGDPVDGRYVIRRTTDGGTTWTPVPAAGMPEALPGESAFAASGTCLVVEGRRNAWFATGGGPRARVFRSNDRGLTWSVAETPVTAGVASAGIFSVAFADARHGIAVGGDYRREQEASDNVAVTSDGGATWVQPEAKRLRAFRSAVAYLPGRHGRRLVTVGPAGGDLSLDGGASWRPLGDEGFHALDIGGRRAIWAVGEQGRIARLGRIVVGDEEEENENEGEEDD